jgi:hypothetical protein
MITKEDIASFKNDGILILKNFFDLRIDIEPIQHAIYRIIGQVIAENGLPVKQVGFSPDSFDSGFQDVIQSDRKLGGVIYDAVKQCPSFIRLCSDVRLEQVFNILRNTELAGIAAGGYGIRINNPNEEQFRAEWHQEYPAQLRSPDGIVYWSPLVKVTKELGPVKVAVGSQAEGLLPVFTYDPENETKKGAYSLTLKDKRELLDKYEIIEPLTNPGDLIVMDFCTIHASGHNVSSRSLWSMQLRYFNFNNAVGRKNKWCGSFASGIDFTKIHPELIANNNP